MAQIKFVSSKTESFALSSSATTGTIYFTKTALAGGQTRCCIILDGMKYSEVINGGAAGSSSGS